MCGRYAGFLPPEAIARIFGTTNPLRDLAPSWNVAPTSDVAVVRRHPETGARQPRSAEVGFAALIRSSRHSSQDGDLAKKLLSGLCRTANQD
jgi:putative SOS response-associated peptidase YedK